MYLMLKVIKRREVAILITFERGLIMKILVLVKRVVYPYLRIRVKPDVSGIAAQQLKMVMNPFNEIDLEEAIRLRGKRPGDLHRFGFYG